jgi:YegS/Rv2252/BmrU family lipid kinase
VPTRHDVATPSGSEHPLLTDARVTGRRVLVVYNPTAGRRRDRRLQESLAQLEAAGCRVRLETTRAPGDATSIGWRAATSGAFDVIAAAGGDGTVSEVARGLAGSGVSLAVIPLGTANVLAHELGIGHHVRRAVAAIARGTPRPLHLGRVNGEPFVLMVGAGFDADVVARRQPAIKRRLGKLAYILAALREWRQGAAPRCQVRLGGERHDAVCVVVSNARCYGGRFVLAPAADIGVLGFQVTVFAPGSRLDLLRYATALVRGRVATCRGVSVHPASEVELYGPAGLQADGDPRGPLPARVTTGELVSVLVGPGAREG